MVTKKDRLQSFYKGKKILITGTTGFKGSWLTQILLNWEADITGVSLLPSTEPNLFTALNLGSRITNIISDIRDYKNLSNIMTIVRPEIVFHLAAQPLVRISYDDPLNTYTTNVIGTANLLQSIKESESVKAAVIITTDKVYENKEWIYPYRENDILGGHDPYSASKAAADIIVQSYIKSFFSDANNNKLIAIARAGNVIGGGDWNKDRIVTDIVRSIYEKKENILIRSPKAVRPWEHVLEPISGYLLLAKNLYNGDKSMVGAWNFGPNNKSFTNVKTLVIKAIKIMKKGKYTIDERVTILHEAGILTLDISKARNSLNWSPILNLEKTFKLTFNWYRKYYKNPKAIIKVTNKQITDYFIRYEKRASRSN